MSDVDIEHLRTWIGRERAVQDIITPRLARSLCAILDVDRPTEMGDPAPAGIHWCLAPDIVPMREIGVDGHPAHRGFLPLVPFPRRMWAGGELRFAGELRIGDTVTRRSMIEDVVLKSGRSGEMIFVTVRHSYETSCGSAIEERQDVVFRKLEEPRPTATVATDQASAPEVPTVTRALETNPVLLFRYSAITFNGHRIHYDQPYTTGSEGYSDLVVHGPLQATLLLALAVKENSGALPERLSFRSIRPLLGSGTISINARPIESGLSLWINDQSGKATMQASAFI